MKRIDRLVAGGSACEPNGPPPTEPGGLGPAEGERQPEPERSGGAHRPASSQPATAATGGNNTPGT
jgi:hypothetical protein